MHLIYAFGRRMRTRIRELSQSAGNLTPEVLIQIGRLRLLAWDASGERLIQARTAREVWLDEHDQHAAHFIIENDERLTAAARLCFHDEGESLPDEGTLREFRSQILWPAAFFNRLVVHPHWRGQGISRYMDRFRLIRAHEAKMRCVVVTSHGTRNAQLAAQGFRHLGFSSVRELDSELTLVSMRCFSERANFDYAGPGRRARLARCKT
jgi:GNAT superfamily N-acetyltransferase